MDEIYNIVTIYHNEYVCYKFYGYKINFKILYLVAIKLKTIYHVKLKL
jgi:hypothetical protein